MCVSACVRVRESAKERESDRERERKKEGETLGGGGEAGALKCQTRPSFLLFYCQA